MIESLSFYCSFEILIHFKPMTWPHFIETARLGFCGTNMKQTSFVFTLGDFHSRKTRLL